MLRRRRRKQCVTSQCFVGDEWREASRREQLLRPGLEAHRPVVRLDGVASPGVGVEIVYQIATAHDQYAFVAQWREPLRYFVVKRRGLRLVDAQLHDGNVGAGVDVHEHRPGPVIEPPMLIHRDILRCKQLPHARRERPRARSRILHLE